MITFAHVFRFKKFTIHQDRCAMKVGTDGVLLGAWAPGGRRILDIGTGTGLIAIMMAQRFNDAEVVGIDIDCEACKQANENAEASPFGDRIRIENVSLQAYFSDNADKGLFDCIVSNPPFFENSLECPDSQRSTARHTVSLSFDDLMRIASQLLTADGVFSLIIPTDRIPHIEQSAALNCMYVTHRLDIKTMERKAPKRTMLTLSRKRPDHTPHSTEVLNVNGARSEWYSALTQDFYL